MKLRNLLFSAILSMFCFGAMAQENIIKSAQTYTQAYIDSDVDKLFFLTHPNIVSMGGGKEYVLEDIRRERMAFDNMNMKFVSGDVGTPSIPVTENGELQVIVPVKYVVDLNGDKYESNSSLFAGSSDDGETWRFVNLDQHDRESLLLFIPSLSDQIKFPEQKGFIKTEDK